MEFMKNERLIRSWLLPSIFVFAFFFRSQTVHAQEFSLSGMMVHSDLEGGCWYLQDSEGKHYELFGDSGTIENLHRPALVVDLTVERMKNGASTCMVGELVHVIRIQSIRQQPY